MIIGGLQKTSLIDYPNKVSAIIFTVGCNFRCGFCHNPELVTTIDKKYFITQKKIFEFLKKRKKVLDAVVITGGEPTMHADLPEFIRKIKKLGYLVKLDSNGTHPQMLKKLIKANLIDYIAMDIKSPLKKYAVTVDIGVDTKKIASSIKLIMSSGLPYEFRSTILPQLHSLQDIKAMAKLIKGSPIYYLQKFIPSGNLINQDFNKLKPFTDQQMKALAKACLTYVKKCKIR